MVTLGLSVGRGATSRNASEAIEPRNYYLYEDADAVILVAGNIMQIVMVRFV